MYYNTPLLTDLYQLTMAYGYWKTGMAERPAIFHLFYRKNPFQNRYVLAAGLEHVIQWLESFHFDVQEIQYLGGLKGSDGKPLFNEGFLNYLQRLSFNCSIHAVPEGTAVLPHMPLLRVEGPILQAQLIETALLNMINFSSLIATKASRISLAAQGDPILEFGLRRAQGPDGAMMASRAAFIGGCQATSNVLAGQLFKIPVKGTHAHSWVMAFDSELEAFLAYADALPNNVILLVDTYDTRDGVQRAIQTGHRLREQGADLGGIRLDSGDLAQLSIEARKLLDEAGFQQTKIVASDSLDEHRIRELKAQGARIDVWGVGTRLATAHDQPALGGVYKLAAMQGEDGLWQDKIKRSELTIKTSIPGKLQVKRIQTTHTETQFLLYDELHPVPNIATGIPFSELPPFEVDMQQGKELLIPVFEHGKCIYQSPPISDIQQYAQSEMNRMEHANAIDLGMEQGLHQRREALIEAARAGMAPSLKQKL